MKGTRALSVGAICIALVGALGLSQGTWASFTGSSSNPNNSFGLTSLYAPSGLTATVSGRTVGLTWPAGQNGTGYRLSAAPAPDQTNPACASAPFTQIATPAGTAYTDPRFSPQGTWYCYQTETRYQSWTSVENNPTALAQLGFVASTVQINNGGTVDRVDDLDTIVVTFNQPVAVATGPQNGHSICWVDGKIILGSVQSGQCASNDSSPRLGFLTGGLVSRNFRYAATWAWSNGNRTLTISVGDKLTGAGNNTATGNWTFTPTPNTAFLQSAAGSFHVCDNNAGGANCLPTAATGF